MCFAPLLLLLHLVAVAPKGDAYTCMHALKIRTEDALVAIADLEAVARQIAAGVVLDPALLRRVRERSGVVRGRLRRERGEADNAVDLVREVRDEE